MSEANEAGQPAKKQRTEWKEQIYRVNELPLELVEMIVGFVNDKQLYALSLLGDTLFPRALCLTTGRGGVRHGLQMPHSCRHPRAGDPDQTPFLSGLVTCDLDISWWVGHLENICIVIPTRCTSEKISEWLKRNARRMSELKKIEIHIHGEVSIEAAELSNAMPELEVLKIVGHHREATLLAKPRFRMKTLKHLSLSSVTVTEMEFLVQGTTFMESVRLYKCRWGGGAFVGASSVFGPWKWLIKLELSKNYPTVLDFESYTRCKELRTFRVSISAGVADRILLSLPGFERIDEIGKASEIIPSCMAHLLDGPREVRFVDLGQLTDQTDLSNIPQCKYTKELSFSSVSGACGVDKFRQLMGIFRNLERLEIDSFHFGVQSSSIIATLPLNHLTVNNVRGLRLGPEARHLQSLVAYTSEVHFDKNLKFDKLQKFVWDCSGDLRLEGFIMMLPPGGSSSLEVFHWNSASELWGSFGAELARMTKGAKSVIISQQLQGYGPHFDEMKTIWSITQWTHLQSMVQQWAPWGLLKRAASIQQFVAGGIMFVSLSGKESADQSIYLALTMQDG